MEEEYTQTSQVMDDDGTGAAASYSQSKTEEELEAEALAALEAEEAAEAAALPANTIIYIVGQSPKYIDLKGKKIFDDLRVSSTQSTTQTGEAVDHARTRIDSEQSVHNPSFCVCVCGRLYVNRMHCCRWMMSTWDLTWFWWMIKIMVRHITFVDSESVPQFVFLSAILTDHCLLQRVFLLCCLSSVLLSLSTCSEILGIETVWQLAPFRSRYQNSNSNWGSTYSITI